MAVTGNATERTFPMLVQLTTDNHVSGHAERAERVETDVRAALERFTDQITRVEVHLNDENSSEKGGGNDKRCLLEARLAGLQPITVTEHSSNVYDALAGALDKLVTVLDKTLDKLSDHKGRTSFGGDQTI
jgi:ribosomal subunit interface protein